MLLDRESVVSLPPAPHGLSSNGLASFYLDHVFKPNQNPQRQILCLMEDLGIEPPVPQLSVCTLFSYPDPTMCPVPTPAKSPTFSGNWGYSSCSLGYWIAIFDHWCLLISCFQDLS